MWEDRVQACKDIPRSLDTPWVDLTKSLDTERSVQRPVIEPFVIDVSELVISC